MPYLQIFTGKYSLPRKQRRQFLRGIGHKVKIQLDLFLHVDVPWWIDEARLLVDEIGKLELWRGVGLAPVLPRLAAGEVERALVLVRDSLRAELQAKLGPVDQRVFEASEGNLGTLPRQILEGLL